MPYPRAAAIVLLVGWLFSPLPSSAADPFWGADPTWSLLHEPAVARELALSPLQSRQFRDLLDELDGRFFPLRNQPSEEAGEKAADILRDATRQCESILSDRQSRRLSEIQTRQQGTSALLRAGMKRLLEYKPGQSEQLERVISHTRAATQELEMRATKGEPREPLEKEFARLKEAEMQDIVGILSSAQRTTWQKALGRDFDVRALGRPAYKPPELVESGGWLNSVPLTMKELTGKVVVVHFYAFGCINCIHNYPTYREWQERFRGKDVVILGIHTPETAAEQDTASVSRKADDAEWDFPVLIDSTKANWNAWGNSMWPSVYLVDRRGYLRYFWPGELKWEGATGDVWMRERIEELLAEPPP